MPSAARSDHGAVGLAPEALGADAGSKLRDGRVQRLCDFGVVLRTDGQRKRLRRAIAGAGATATVHGDGALLLAHTLYV